MIDRAFTKAEARYIPNGPSSTTRHGPSDPHGRPRRRSRSRRTSTTRRRRARWSRRRTSSASTGTSRTFRTCPRTSTCGRRSSPAARGSRKGQVTAKTIDLAPTLAFLLGIPEPQHSQGRVLLDVVKGGESYRPISIVGPERLPRPARADDARPSTTGSHSPSAAPPFLATMFDEEIAALPGPASRDPGLILAAGDNVGASPPNSALLEDMPAIDVENAWGLDATSYGNHEFDYGVARLLAQQARAHFPFLATNIVDAVTGQAPPWVTPSPVFTVNGVQVGVIGAELESTPELVSAGATAGLKFLDEATADQGGVRAAARARRQGPDRRHPRGDAPSARTRSATRPERRGRARSWGSPTSSRTRPSTR